MLAFFIVLLKNLLIPLAASIALSLATKARIGLWLGMAISPVISLVIVALVVRWRCVKENRRFPFMISTDRNHDIFIYDFILSHEAIMEMLRMADEVMKTYAISANVKALAEVFMEDIFMLAGEKNTGKSNMLAECTMLFEPAGMRVILRDSGVIFNATDEEALPDSFRQYVVASLMSMQEKKAYMTTTGYNRIELFFADAYGNKGIVASQEERLAKVPGM